VQKPLKQGHVISELPLPEDSFCFSLESMAFKITQIFDLTANTVNDKLNI
jgi:hypothetical protein